MKLEENVMLGPFTTFHIGGPARYFARVRNANELTEALSFASEKRLPTLVFGGGSNMLIADEGFEGVVIKMESAEVEWRAHDSLRAEVIADAGVNWDTLVRASVARGLHGLENLSGIPGTVGAAPVQNIGAYGAELKDICLSVDAFDARTRELVHIPARECGFGYRDSMFKREEGKHLVIMRVTLMLQKSAPPNIAYKDLAQHFDNAQNPDPTLEEIRDAVLMIRSRKFPDLSRFGTAGSFFKNPVLPEKEYAALAARFAGMPGFPDGQGGVKIPLAWVLDTVIGAKGARKGGASCWSEQPLVIATEQGAHASDVIALSTHIAEEVRTRTGIEIEREVQIIDPKPSHAQ